MLEFVLKRESPMTGQLRVSRLLAETNDTTQQAITKKSDREE